MRHDRPVQKLVHVVSLAAFGIMGYVAEEKIGQHVDPVMIHEVYCHRAAQMREAFRWARCTGCSE